MKQLYLLPLAALICACTGQGGSNNSITGPLDWDSTSLRIERPIAPDESLCYQIDLRFDTLAGESELARHFASMLLDSVFHSSSRQSVQEAMTAFADSIETAWKSDLADNYEPESEFKDMFQYYYNFDGSPVENGNDSVLSYQTTLDYYLGGAHGCYVVSYFNFDKISGKLLSIRDIVPADREKEVLKAMEVQLCEDWNVENKEELQEQTGITVLGDLFLTNNFLLKKDSIEFLFNQYEIAPYASGLIGVTIPFAPNR